MLKLLFLVLIHLFVIFNTPNLLANTKVIFQQVISHSEKLKAVKFSQRDLRFGSQEKLIFRKLKLTLCGAKIFALVTGMKKMTYLSLNDTYLSYDVNVDLLQVEFKMLQQAFMIVAMDKADGKAPFFL